MSSWGRADKGAIGGTRFSDSSQIPSGVNLGPAISVAGVPWMWDGVSAYYHWAGIRSFNNPPASGAYIGEDIWVPNAAVPLGKSKLRWNGIIWAPPAGEPIVMGVSSSGTAPIALVTPGVLTLAQIWASPVIPDYMIPDRLEMDIAGNFGVYNGSGVAGSMLGLALSGDVPTGVSSNDYPSFASVTPTSDFRGLGGSDSMRKFVSRRNGAFRFANGSAGTTLSSYDKATSGAFVSGANRVYAMGKAAHTGDQFRLDGVAVYSRGNL